MGSNQVISGEGEKIYPAFERRWEERKTCLYSRGGRREDSPAFGKTYQHLRNGGRREDFTKFKKKREEEKTYLHLIMGRRKD